jgi:hypothetical protein
LLKEHIVQIFHKDTEKPDQAFLSNSSTLVKKQQTLFDDLWKMGYRCQPEIKSFCQINPDYRRTLQIMIYLSRGKINP